MINVDTGVEEIKGWDKFVAKIVQFINLYNKGNSENLTSLDNNTEKFFHKNFRFQGDFAFKMKFLSKILSEYKQSTTTTYVSLFNSISNFEKMYDKDIYNFTLEELEITLKGLKCSSYSVISSQFSRLKNYITYAIDEKKFPKAQEYIYMIDEHKLKSYINMNKMMGKYVTYEELKECLTLLKNYQDKVIFILAWLGIMGESYKDMTNLRSDQFDYRNGIIRLDDSKEIQVDDYCKEIIQNAIEEEYYVKHDLSKGDMKSLRIRFKEGCPYIIKSNKRDKDGEAKPLTQNAIKRRVMIYKLNLKDSSEPLHIYNKSIYLSGIAWRLINEEKERKKPYTTEEIRNSLSSNGINSSVTDIVRVMKLLKEKIG